MTLHCAWSSKTGLAIAVVAPWFCKYCAQGSAGGRFPQDCIVWSNLLRSPLLRWDVMPTPPRGIQENTIAIACRRSFARRLRRPVSSRPIWENTAIGWFRGQHNTVECAIKTKPCREYQAGTCGNCKIWLQLRTYIISLRTPLWLFTTHGLAANGFGSAFAKRWNFSTSEGNLWRSIHHCNQQHMWQIHAKSCKYQVL